MQKQKSMGNSFHFMIDYLYSITEAEVELTGEWSMSRVAISKYQ